MEGFPIRLQMVSAEWEDVSLKELLVLSEAGWSIFWLAVGCSLLVVGCWYWGLIACLLGCFLACLLACLVPWLLGGFVGWLAG